MPREDVVLLMGVDCGNTAIKAAIFDTTGATLAVASRRTTVICPAPGHVEQDMHQLWASAAAAMREAVERSGRPPGDIGGIGVTAHGKFKFIVAEGESVRGPIPATGNTNTRAFFRPDVRTFLKRWVAEGPTHHFALGIGHRAQSLRRIGEALGIETSIINLEQ